MSEEKMGLESAWYFGTICDFNEAMRTYGARAVLRDLRALDLTTYEKLVTIVMSKDEIEKKTAAIFRETDAR